MQQFEAKSKQLLLDIQGVGKQFSHVVVLKDINFSLYSGQIHALLGGNGAGKSTLMKIIVGIEQPDRGKIQIYGDYKENLSPTKAHQLGIYLVPQEPMLFPNLTVKENILFYLPKHQQNEKKLHQLLEQLDCNLDLNMDAGILDVADQQIVEIMRGLMRDSKILILDEPTASLTPKETEKLFQQLRLLQKQGVGMIFITHKLGEVYELADYVSVMCDGFISLQGKLSLFSKEHIIQAIAPESKIARAHLDGRMALVYTSIIDRKNQKTLLSLRQVAGEGFTNIDLDLYPGEIVGLAGVVGAGRTELAESIYGLRKFYSGNIFFDGKNIINAPLSARLKSGLIYLPEDRQASGLFIDSALSWNVVSLTYNREGFWINNKKEQQTFDKYRNTLGIKCDRPDQYVRTLSGGNQQKILLAKCLEANPKLLIIDEPTRGVDVGARAEIYELIRRIAKEGVAVLLISSDLEEIIYLSERVFVMHHGQLSEELTENAINVDNIMHIAFGC